ncbi:MAG TPA: WYL domain-containing protein [Candidatus Acidoferrales bacterium]|nr:WYL domain-containing protein [Candidatus Acidoferrales bacterium]
MKRRPRPAREVLQSRPPMERMLRIHQAILAGKFPNATGLARELEVSSKSIQRDIEFMRDRLRLPIAYDGQRWGYHYTEEVTHFPTLQITEGEMFALLVAEKALQQYRGTTFEAPLVSAFNKMASALPDTISLNLADWGNTISFRTRAEPILDLKVFDLLSRAAAQRQQLKLTYRKPARRETETRIVDPYHLANINGEWFLFAWCHLRRDIRTFAPARIQAVELTGQTFTRPQKFSLEKRLRDSFGVQSGHEKHDVVIRFNETVSDYIREKKWHESQRLKELPDGGVELSLSLSGLAEVERWVLSWAGNASVIQPPELADKVRQAARNILAAQ